MKFRPLGDRVLVLPLDQEHKIEGFQLPDSATEKEARIGLVLSVGPKVTENLKPQDKIVYGAYAGIEMLIGGESFMQMREGEIFGVIEGDTIAHHDPAVCEKCHQAWCLCPST